MWKLGENVNSLEVKKGFNCLSSIRVKVDRFLILVWKHNRMTQVNMLWDSVISACFEGIYMKTMLFGAPNHLINKKRHMVRELVGQNIILSQLRWKSRLLFLSLWL